jgi:hypothetical protein
MEAWVGPSPASRFRRGRIRRDLRADVGGSDEGIAEVGLAWTNRSIGSEALGLRSSSSAHGSGEDLPLRAGDLLASGISSGHSPTPSAPDDSGRVGS